MFIKQIIIQGFKSYKEQTVMEPFSPGTNVVVGRNGSGKSNFFAAIRFVLNDGNTNMTREERHSLLHEGTGAAVTQAYVEIIFDNSDGRFQGHGEEVIIRRSIHRNKDEYSLDKRMSTKSEIMSLLEGAGFSKSNPYYIVPQGRVQALTNMKESDRLNLLKEIAGTNTYETRRTESLKIMEETNKKRAKIDDLLTHIQGRLRELESEKEELRSYQEKDKEKRCLQYAYHYHEQERTKSKLEEIEAYEQDSGASSKEHHAFQQNEEAISDMAKRQEELQHQLDILTTERRGLDAERKEKSRARAKAELTAKNLDETRQERDQTKRKHWEKLRNVQRQIAESKAELAKIKPQLDKLSREEEGLKEIWERAKRERDRLIDKRTRGSQFKSQNDRDAFLNERITELSASISSNKAVSMDADEAVREAETHVAQIEKQIEEFCNKASTFGDQQRTLDDELRDAQEKRKEFGDQRAALRRERDRLNKNYDKLLKYLNQAKQDLSHQMPRSVPQALEGIRRFTQERSVAGAYGTIADLMTMPNDHYRVAIEQTAGQQLFHYVVDNAETATLLCNHLEQSKGGRLTFLPLEQLRVKNVNYPRGDDAVPIIDKIQFDPRFEKAFKKVFGQTVVCPNLNVCTQYSRSHNLATITADGDKTNKRGVLTGGYIDKQKSRLKTFRRVKELREQTEEVWRERDKIDRQIKGLEQPITSLEGEIYKIQRQLDDLKSEFGSSESRMREMMQERQRQLDVLEASKKHKAGIEANLKKLHNDLTSDQEELKTNFKRALSAQEEQQLEEYSGQAEQLAPQYTEAFKHRAALELKKTDLDKRLHQLVGYEFTLNSQGQESLLEGSVSNDATAKRELNRAQRALAQIEKEVQEIEQQSEEIRQELVSIDADKAKVEAEQEGLAKQIEKRQKAIEQDLQRKSLLNDNLKKITNSIRLLGVLPDEAFGKYQRMSSGQVSKRLEKVNEALKKYKHVNKKAFEQYNSFTQRQDELTKRRRELDTSQQSIEKLIEHLDQAKDEAIERTFKQVSREFATIFEQLVPAGHGRLVIQRRTDRRGNRNADDSEDEHQGIIESYIGVGISVSFNSKTQDEQQKIQQLSGGQKSLCALCLIFAIQATETSPMVIFDEVDANLDAQYRTSVAGLLQEISQRNPPTQFICTTFRPEIVMVADKCYGVTFRNKTSTIDCVPTEEALNFVEGQQKR